MTAKACTLICVDFVLFNYITFYESQDSAGWGSSWSRDCGSRLEEENVQSEREREISLERRGCQDLVRSRDSQSEMSVERLRQSIFPNIPPYLTFIPPEERYVEGEECPEELVIHYTVAQWTSLTVRETIERFGARIVEVGSVRQSTTDSSHLGVARYFLPS